MAYHTVSEESLQKVHDFLVSEVKKTGLRRVQMTVPAIANGSGVSLATAHKATKALEDDGVINIITSSSRKIPNIYEYKLNIEDYDTIRRETDQVDYLKNLVNSLTEEKAHWRNKYYEADYEVKRLRNMLGITTD